VNEIGIRVALGAYRTDVVGMILRQALRLAGAGVLFGVAGALLLTRFMEQMLYGVTPTDLPTFVQIALLTLVVSAVAAFLPARRASRVDPMEALRYE
jgi:ABC-type antimicrobial peptide transport system permease subunit